MNADRMRRNLHRRWRGLPRTRTFTAVEIEQNQRTVESWYTSMQSPPNDPAPIADWVGRVRSHNPGRTETVSVEHPADGSVTLTIRRPK